MQKILYIANYKGAVGGISGQVSLLSELLSVEGYETRIFTTIGNPFLRLWRFFVLICITPNYDVVHIHGCSDWGFLPIVFGVVAGKIWRKRIVVTYHGGDAAIFFRKHPNFVRRWLCRADERIVLSGFLKEVFDNYRIPCVIIPNILPAPKQVIDRTIRTIIKPRFISVRHFTELYNVACTLRAFKRVQAVWPEAELVLLGQGHLRAELEQWVEDNQVQHVHFVGQVPHEEVANYLMQADVMVSSPRIDNMPVSIMEAMQMGLLVISSRVGGVPYVVEDGVTGLLYSYDDDQELSEKMLWALQRTAEALTIVESAKREVIRYDWKNVRTSLIKLYE